MGAWTVVCAATFAGEGWMGTQADFPNWFRGGQYSGGGALNGRNWLRRVTGGALNGRDWLGAVFGGALYGPPWRRRAGVGADTGGGAFARSTNGWSDDGGCLKKPAGGDLITKGSYSKSGGLCCVFACAKVS